MNPCEICNTTDEMKPMCYRGERWCSESHRKEIMKDPPRKTY